MKVQYLGDVNDYRKFALLRLLARTGLKLGVHWLLTPDDDRSDGGKRNYLAQRDIWRPYDPNLFDQMANVPPVPTFNDFQKVEKMGTIPEAAYFDLTVPTGIEAREEFHAASMKALQSSDLVFFDPDNGLAIKSTSKNRKTGIKFVFDDELSDHYRAGRSILVYQHFPHVEQTSFIRALGARLRKFAPDADIWACRTSHVVFMLVANPTHKTKISAAIETGRKEWPESFIKFEHNPAG